MNNTYEIHHSAAFYTEEGRDLCEHSQDQLKDAMLQTSAGYCKMGYEIADFKVYCFVSKHGRLRNRLLPKEVRAEFPVNKYCAIILNKDEQNVAAVFTLNKDGGIDRSILLGKNMLP